MRDLAVLLALLLGAGPAWADAFSSSPPFTGQIPASGLTQNGGTIFVQGPLGTYQSTQAGALFMGYNAGAAFPIASPDQYGSIGIGSNSLMSYTTIEGETTCVGALSCQFMTTGALNTAFGMHAGGTEVSTSNNVWIGNDSGRNSISTTGGLTAVGGHTVASGKPAAIVAVGLNAAHGNSGGVLLSGTVTAGDMITVSLSASGSTPGTVYGLPLSYTHTVVGGDTLSTIASDISNHLDGVVGGVTFTLHASSVDLPDGTSAVRFDFPGSTTNGWAITVAGSKSAGATEALTVIGGSSPSQSTMVGQSAGEGEAMGTVTNLGLFGFGAGKNITTGNYNDVFGNQSGTNITTGTGNSIFGEVSAQLLTTGKENTILGFQSGTHITNSVQNTIVGGKSGWGITGGGNNTILGHNVGQTNPTTGTGNILIGSGAQFVDAAAGNSTGTINIENTIKATGTGTPSTSLVSVSGIFAAHGYTVAGLPTCNAGNTGAIAYVTDASAPTYNAALTGGGAVVTLAMCNGSSWTAH